MVSHTDESSDVLQGKPSRKICHATNYSTRMTPPHSHLTSDVSPFPTPKTVEALHTAYRVDSKIRSTPISYTYNQVTMVSWLSRRISDRASHKKQCTDVKYNQDLYEQTKSPRKPFVRYAYLVLRCPDILIFVHSELVSPEFNLYRQEVEESVDLVSV